MIPYDQFDPNAFWKSCCRADDFAASSIYSPKTTLTAGTRIATAGSCFAQNIGRYLGQTDADLLQVEPAPDGMLPETAKRFGYGLYSARYGNIYTARQLLQLVEDSQDPRCRDEAIWQTQSRFFDALRPGTEPDGLAERQHVIDMRLDHLKRVRQLFLDTDVFIFTLGLTEYWQHKTTGTAFPTCPGVIAGQFDPDQHGFCNAGFAQVKSDLEAAFAILRANNPTLRVLLTVSPVPLTATATGQHVLSASTYSKSVLRAVAGEMSGTTEWIDYFPSYELITGAPFKAAFFAPNLRQVTEAGVNFVMQQFFAAHPGLNNAHESSDQIFAPTTPEPDDDMAEICEEVLLDAFAK